MTELLDDLTRVLQSRRPDNVLLLRKSPAFDADFKQISTRLKPVPDFTTADPAAWLHRPRLEQRYQLGLLWDSPTALPDADYDHLLARLRDLDCEAVYARCLVQSGDTQQRSRHLRSLGFLPLKEYADGTALFYFDIYDYKLLPDWLNSKFWANPAMWNKARW